jgi:flavin reductase (DIM6/NTAB) family NADH-FMN oxidoreductase RutF
LQDKLYVILLSGSSFSILSTTSLTFFNLLCFQCMELISASSIRTWERSYRANFINSLTGFKSVNLIGTVNSAGKTNLGVFSSIVHIGSDPALVGYINRPTKAAPHTISNIQASGLYTINHIQPSFLEKAHQTSAKYADEVSEFDEVGLTPEFMESIQAPFVKESRVKYALSLKEIIPIQLNNTFLVIGEILYVKLEDDILLDDGFLSLDKASSLCSNGTDGYYSTQLINRYHYAKPGVHPKKIE